MDYSAETIKYWWFFGAKKEDHFSPYIGGMSI